MRHFWNLLGSGSFYFSPATDNEGGGEQPDLLAQLSEAAEGVQEETAPAEQPAAQPAPQATSPNQGQAPSAPAPPAPPSVPAWREVASELGFNLPDAADERAVLRQLYAGYRDGRQAQAQMQSILPHWSEFQQWQAKQQQQPTQQQTEQAKASWRDKYKPVEYDQSWRGMVEQDPLTGEVRAKPGAPMDVLSRLQAAEDARRNLATMITDPTKPFAWLEDPVNEMAARVAEDTFKRLRAEERQHEFAQRTIQSEEMAWIYQRNEGGEVLTDMQGAPLLSDYGRVYRDAAAQLHAQGLPNELQHEYALAKAREAYALNTMNQQSKQQGAAPPATKTPRQQKVEKFHQQHERTPNMAGMIPGPAEGFSPPPTNTGSLDLRDMLALSVKDMTDEDARAFALGKERMAG